MNAIVVYEDPTVVIDQSGVTIKRYYFPLGNKKFVPFSHIRSTDSGVLPGLGGRWRLWGSSDLLNWYSLDLRRPTKDFAVALDVGGRIAPSFTPDDPDRVVSEIRARIESV